MVLLYYLYKSWLTSIVILPDVAPAGFTHSLVHLEPVTAPSQPALEVTHLSRASIIPVLQAFNEP